MVQFRLCLGRTRHARIVCSLDPHLLPVALAETPCGTPHIQYATKHWRGNFEASAVEPVPEVTHGKSLINVKVFLLIRSWFKRQIDLINHPMRILVGGRYAANNQTTFVPNCNHNMTGIIG